MIEIVLKGIVNLLWGWVGIAALVAAAAIAVAVVFPPLRRFAIEVAVGAIAFALVSTHYYKEGFSYGTELKQAEWDAAVQRASDAGEKARTDAEESITSEPAPPAGRVDERLRNDPYNRDRP